MNAQALIWPSVIAGLLSNPSALPNSGMETFAFVSHENIFNGISIDDTLFLEDSDVSDEVELGVEKTAFLSEESLGLVPIEAKSIRELELRKDVQSYYALQDGWDGPGSFAPSDIAKELMSKVIDELPSATPIPSASITSSGDLLLYWDERDYFLDMEFESKGNISFFARSKVRAGRELYREADSYNDTLPILAELLDSVA
jgi:hypothetical protein